jgi:predicted amidohydrolase
MANGSFFSSSFSSLLLFTLLASLWPSSAFALTQSSSPPPTCAFKLIILSTAIFDENGVRILHRRKIKPSHYERVLFGEGGRTFSLAFPPSIIEATDQLLTPPAESAITTVSTSVGRISVLNCWEHFQPLLKYATYERPLIHIAAWPMLHPHGGTKQWSHCNDSVRLFLLPPPLPSSSRLD